MTAAPLTRLSDDALVARFRAGDDDAFTEIHRRFRAPLLAFARRMLHARADGAEDVVQDAFMRAHRGLRATDRPIALRPWLYMIVRNRALDDLRAPRRTESCEQAGGLAAVPESDPAHAVAEREAMRELVAEIGRLPERQRLALVMRELDGRSHAETARALRTTVPATKSLLVRARSNLGTALHAA